MEPTWRALASVLERSESREHLLREVLASGASEGSSERALTADEERNERSADRREADEYSNGERSDP